MNQTLPKIITLKSESPTNVAYDNHPIANINDHVVRISTMTEPYYWHFHANSDEAFLVIEGRLAIEFESGSLELAPGQLLTVPREVRHRTRPVGERCVSHLRDGPDGDGSGLTPQIARCCQYPM